MQTDTITSTIETNICVVEMLGKTLDKMWSMKVIKIKLIENTST